MIWSVILALAVGSFLLRLSFLGLIGDRQMPDWLLRHLRYTAVAILPALVAPMVVWEDGPGTGVDALQIVAALAALAVGYATRSMFLSMIAGALVLVALLFVT